MAARSISTMPNVYADELYSLPYQSPTAPRTPRRIASFDMDVYEYPPPFLLLPRALMILAPDFLRFRMIWFALNGAVMLIGVLVIARMLGPVAGTRALLLSPLVLASSLTVNTLQVGNLQAMVFSLAMIAMMLLNQRRYAAGGAAGGALLAYVTMSKLFPGMLLVYLLVQRKWRALAWTIGLVAAEWRILPCLSQSICHREELLCSRNGFQTPLVWRIRRLVWSDEGRGLDLHDGGIGSHDPCRKADMESRAGAAGLAGNPDLGFAA